MCGSMADIQSAAAEIRRGKKEEEEKPQHENIMVCPIPQGDHNKDEQNIVMHCIPQMGQGSQCDEFQTG